LGTASRNGRITNGAWRRENRSILNIIMNKLIWRMFAVIRHNKPFERNPDKYHAEKIFSRPSKSQFCRHLQKPASALPD
jgi:hypothetical protein